MIGPCQQDICNRLNKNARLGSKTERIVLHSRRENELYTIVVKHLFSHLRHLVDENQSTMESGEHNLGLVPVIRSFNRRNPKYDFQQPKGALDEVVKISLKIFETMSQLDQLIIGHAFLKIAMPKSMFDEVSKSGVGVHNILVYPDGYIGQQAHYVEMPSSEIETLVNLIFERYPRMILEMANVREKTDTPREESGIAKSIDSTDELSNLIDKAESMELAERQITELAARWEGIRDHETTISYSKNFDVKSVNEMLSEMVELFE